MGDGESPLPLATVGVSMAAVRPLIDGLIKPVSDTRNDMSVRVHTFPPDLKGLAPVGFCTPYIRCIVLMDSLCMVAKPSNGILEREKRVGCWDAEIHECRTYVKAL